MEQWKKTREENQYHAVSVWDTLPYRWFLGYGLLEDIPHFAAVSCAFCKRFTEELTSEVFGHILNKKLNNRMVDPGEKRSMGNVPCSFSNGGNYLINLTSG